MLPFAPLVAAQRDEALELGLAEALITRLSARATLSPLSAVRRYGAIETDAQTAGRELGAQAVLAGSLQRTDDKIRLTARLIETATGRTLWAQQFDEPWADDPLAVQDALSQRVAEEMSRFLDRP